MHAKCTYLCYSVDASDVSSCIARYANDEWVEPNARVVKEVIDGEPYLVLKSVRHIKKGEEIRYDYNDKSAPWRVGIDSAKIKWTLKFPKFAIWGSGLVKKVTFTRFR